MGYVAKSRIKRGDRVYVYERENYRDGCGKVKHRNSRYLGVEVTEKGETRIIPPKKRLKEFDVVRSVRFGDVAVLYHFLSEYGIIDLLDDLIPRRGLPVGDVFASLAINHIIDRETLNLFSRWYQDTALEEFTTIPARKMSSSNLSSVMKTFREIGTEGLIDVCIEMFNKVRHLETGSMSLFYDITSTYFYAKKLPNVRKGYSRDGNDLPQINISLAVTKKKGLPIFFRTYEGNITDVNTIQQLLFDIKRVKFNVDLIIMDRGMTSKKNLIDISKSQLHVLGGIPLTSNEAKDLVECTISEENELIRPMGLIYYEDISTSLFGIKGRAIICFNHRDLERERTTRLKKIAIAQKQINKILDTVEDTKDSDHLEKELKVAIKGATNYFIIKNKNDKVNITPNEEERKKARFRDGKCLIFTTDFKKKPSELIALYFGKDIIEKVFNCIKNWLDLQPVRHFKEEIVDVYVFICYLAYMNLALYKHHLGTTGWNGVKDSINEIGRIRKTSLSFGKKKIDKITVLTKEQKEILEKLGLEKKFI